MKLSDQFNDNDDKSKLPVIYMMLGALAFILIVIVVVVAANDKGRRRRKPASYEGGDAVVDETASVDGESEGLRAEDLDFWDMYKEDEPVSSNSVITDKSYEERLKEVEEQEAEKEKEEDLSEGGTKTMVERPDGSQQWIMINSFIKQNNYREEGFVYKDPVMKYIADGKNASYLGLMLDESDQTVDYALLKDAGVQFVMLRYGYRGYESGALKKDERFEDYLAGAKSAGLSIGVYFESAATTQEEAQEEAEFLINGLSAAAVQNTQAAAQSTTQGMNQNTNQTGENGNAANTAQEGQGANPDTQDIADTVVVEQIGEVVPQDDLRLPEPEPVAAIVKNADIVYPVAIKMGQPANHSARTDNIPKTMMSLIAKTFAQKIKEAGYHPIVWANKFWLLRRLDLTQLDIGTEVILEQNGEVPDYPYEFSIWQYQSNGKLSGKKTDSKMLLSFVDYKAG